LVADYPGLTRDRQYGVGRVGAHPYLIIDTGGIGSDTGDIGPLMERQTAAAIDEADHLIFLLDGQEGLTGDDEMLGARLRRTGKPLTLAVNKSENLDKSIVSAEFHALGLGRPVAIAAVHGRGVKQLIDTVLGSLADKQPLSGREADGQAHREGGVQVAVVGRPNVGKSTLINRILGEERLIAFDQPGTTRDAIFVPFEHAGRKYTLIDTAGVRRRARIGEAVEKFSVIKALQAIEQAHVVLLVLDAE